jgi:hypothetical protein
MLLTEVSFPYEEVFAKVSEAKGLLGNATDAWRSPGGYCVSNCISLPYFCLRSLIIDITSTPDQRQQIPPPRPVAPQARLCGRCPGSRHERASRLYKDYDPIIKKAIDPVPSSLCWWSLGHRRAGRAWLRTGIDGRCSSLNSQPHGSRRSNTYGRRRVTGLRHFGGCSRCDHYTRSYLNLRKDPDAEGMDQTASLFHGGRNLYVLR